jgi:hypothetical protein
MKNMIVNVNPDPAQKSLLFDLIDENVTDVPILHEPGAVLVNIPLTGIVNINEELYLGVTVGRFIEIYKEGLKNIAAFKFSSLTNQWYFELPVTEYAKLRAWEMKRYYENKMFTKYPIWKQLNLTNDKEYALLQLTRITELSSEEIMKKIQETIRINPESTLAEIKNFKKSVDDFDFRQFYSLKPTVHRVVDLQTWVTPILNYLVYYYTSCRLRQFVAAQEEKMALCTTFEAVSLFVPIDPKL